MEKLQPIKVNCGLSRTIPLAFDESMSFLELLYAMNSKLTDVINRLNEYQDLFDNIELNFEAIYLELENLRTYINNQISIVRNETNQKIAHTVIGLNATIDYEVNRLEAEIQDISVGQVSVIDPTTGTLGNIQDVINNIYNANRLYAITSSEFDNLELTCSEFDAKQLSAYDFDNYSLELLQ